MAELTGYSEFDRGPDGQLTATAHYDDGTSKRCSVRVSVEREIVRDGEVIASGEVASSDDGGVQVPVGASL